MNNNKKIIVILKQSTHRILVKSIIYRCLGILITLICSYILTGNFALAFKFSLIVEFSQTIVYFIYENCWNNIEWGYENTPTYKEDKNSVIGSIIKNPAKIRKKQSYALDKIEGPSVRYKTKRYYNPSKIVII